MKNNRLIGGILLISGTTIGAGMLALPLSTGVAGFLPALFIFVACFFLMYWTACLFLEVNLCFEGEVNLITMARSTLGRPGEIIAWLGFLLLLYSLLAAYLTGSGPYFGELYNDFFGEPLSVWAQPLPIIVFFGPFLYFGLRYVDVVNRYLMIGLVAAYALMVTLLTPEVEVSRLQHVDLRFTFLSFAVLVTSFGYHIIIPSLTTYLDRDVKAVKRCIFWGSSIPLVIYVLWEVLILGNVPVSGPDSMATIVHPEELSRALGARLHSPVIGYGMRAFGLFAIITSFLGVAQSLFDFLRDGFKLSNSTRDRGLIWVLTFAPPLLFVIISEKGFVAVMEYAGVFIALLIGMLPIMMTWSARYNKKYVSSFKAFGGRGGLVLGFIAYIAIVVLVIGKNIGLMNLDLSMYTG